MIVTLFVPQQVKTCQQVKKMPFLLLATKEGAKEKPAKQVKQEKKKPAKPKKPKVQSENSASVAAASAAMAAPKGIVCLIP